MHDSSEEHDEVMERLDMLESTLGSIQGGIDEIQFQIDVLMLMAHQVIERLRIDS